MTDHDPAAGAIYVSAQLTNARRTLDKCEEALRQCERFFARQAEMNAASHLADRVIYPPIHSAISSTLNGINLFNQTYPLGVNDVISKSINEATKGGEGSQ